ncbi:MAG: N-acetyl-gamma-glutamyl-phosphate reductase [Saccharofermentans sp.]|nr:N-acetyl-gamma-glutamyl-phosphate reductase [Saccharofermentans sp.]
MDKKIKVSIIGSTGYVGAEVVHGFLEHPNVEIAHLTTQSFIGQKFSDIYPVYRGICDIELEGSSEEDIIRIAKDSDLVITALPHGVSSKMVPVIVENGARVIDHSGDFRYKNLETYTKSYKLDHPHPELLSEATYGLPEFYREQLKTTKITANPGCYPTCSLVALAPFLKQGLIKTDMIIIDATSGVTGAGRKSDLAYAYCEVDEAFKPYGAVGHRHTTEISEQCSFLAGDTTGKSVTVTFTPHLAPFKRGMLASIYVKPTDEFKASGIDGETINKVYADFYKDEQFVRVLPGKNLPDVKYVNGSNYIDVNGVYDPETDMIKLFSCQDNLGKGAALQAIQAFNAMFGLPEETGLKNLVRGV